MAWRDRLQIFRRYGSSHYTVTWTDSAQHLTQLKREFHVVKYGKPLPKEHHLVPCGCEDKDEKTSSSGKSSRSMFTDSLSTRFWLLTLTFFVGTGAIHYYLPKDQADVAHFMLSMGYMYLLFLFVPI
jgi:hypothetical protein